MQIAYTRYEALRMVRKFGAVQYAGFELWLTLERVGVFSRHVRMAPLGKRHLWTCFDHLSTREKVRYAQDRGRQATAQARQVIQGARAALVA